MATITLKNDPIKIHRAIKARARTNKRSINGEIIYCLEKVLGLSNDDSLELIKKIEAVQADLNFSISQEEVQRAKIEGRE